MPQSLAQSLGIFCGVFFLKEAFIFLLTLENFQGMAFTTRPQNSRD